MNFSYEKTINFFHIHKKQFLKKVIDYKTYLTTTLAVLETALYDLSPANFTVNL